MPVSDDSWGWAPPPFRAEEALVQLRRSLRALGLSERGSRFEFEAKPVLTVALQEGAIAVGLARRCVRTPDYDQFTLRSGADQRKLLDELQKRLARWKDED